MKKYSILLVAITLALAPLVWADRTELNPGWNMFSPQQDVEVGQQTSQEAEQQLNMLNNSRVDRYLNKLGLRLSDKAPGEKYPYQFKVVNDRGINAFALPGGFLYINRGVIEAADNEAQLAGVIAHEISHVALRHGTNPASKAYISQVPLAILGGTLGSDSTGAVLAQIGAGFAVDSVLLKYSRNAERQADLLGTQILYDAGYDPRAMGQFLRKLAASSQGGLPAFFSSHPNAEDRDELVDAEIVNMGGFSRNLRTDSREFQDIKRYLSGLTGPPETGGTSVARGNTGTGQPGTSGLRILSASYGAKDRFIDVTQRMQSSVQNDRLNLQVTNSSMGGDPNEGELKALLLRYEWAGKAYDVAVPEKQRISIPTEQQLSETNSQGSMQPDQPSNRSRTFENSVMQIEHPDNWNAYGPGNVALTIAPDRGIIGDGQGNQALAYGLIVNIYEPITSNSRSWQQLQPEGYGLPSGRSRGDEQRQQLQPEGYGLPSGTSRSNEQRQQLLENETNGLIEELRHSNSGMRIVNQVDNFRVDGQRALSTYLTNDSPIGGREMNWLVTVRHPEGLLFLVFVAPDREFRNYENTFQNMLYSVRFRR